MKICKTLGLSATYTLFVSSVPGVRSNLMSALLAIFFAVAANAQTVVIDDFEDGNDDDWVRQTVGDGGERSWQVIDGQYNMSTVDRVPVGRFGVTFSTLESTSAERQLGGGQRTRVSCDYFIVKIRLPR